jgi:hypothetical protein
LIDVSEELTASINIALMMESVISSEKPVNIYQIQDATSQKTAIFILFTAKT